MEPVPEATIVRTSFNLSPHDRQVLCVVSLSKTATFSPRNKSIIAPIPSPLPGIIRHMPEKANKDCLAEITFGQIVALLHRGWGGFPDSVTCRGFRNPAWDDQGQQRDRCCNALPVRDAPQAGLNETQNHVFSCPGSKSFLYRLLNSFDDGSGYRQNCCRHSLQDECSWSRPMPGTGWPDWYRRPRQSPYHRRHRAVRSREKADLSAQGLHIAGLSRRIVAPPGA